MTPNTNALGRSIQAARKRARLSQQAVADQLKVVRTTISAIEHGLRRIQAHELVQLAEILGISPSALLQESENNKAEQQPLSLTAAQKRVIQRLISQSPHAILKKILSNTYDSAEMQETIACVLIHILIAQEEAASSEWLQEKERGA